MLSLHPSLPWRPIRASHPSVALPRYIFLLSSRFSLGTTSGGFPLPERRPATPQAPRLGRSGGSGQPQDQLAMVEQVREAMEKANQQVYGESASVN